MTCSVKNVGADKELSARTQCITYNHVPLNDRLYALSVLQQIALTNAMCKHDC